ncbi:MAG: hypothetical protein ACI9MC_002708, partial [Kiritimatiellia bacterium]
PGDTVTWDELRPIRPLADLRAIDVVGLDRVGLVVDGELLDSWPADAVPERWALGEDARWVLLAGWSLDGQHWACTAPIWLRHP